MAQTTIICHLGLFSLLLHVVGAGIVVKPLVLTFQVREGTGNMASGKGGNTPPTHILSEGGHAGQEKGGNTPPTCISNEGGVEWWQEKGPPTRISSEGGM